MIAALEDMISAVEQIGQKLLILFSDTVKPLYSGHQWDLNVVSPLKRGVRYIDVLPKLAYFTSQTCSSVLWYSTTEPEVCQLINQSIDQSVNRDLLV